jgi:hypothetical protein
MELHKGKYRQLVAAFGEKPQIGDVVVSEGKNFKCTGAGVIFSISENDYSVWGISPDVDDGRYVYFVPVTETVTAKAPLLTVEQIAIMLEELTTRQKIGTMTVRSWNKESSIAVETNAMDYDIRELSVDKYERDMGRYCVPRTRILELAAIIHSRQ